MQCGARAGSRGWLAWIAPAAVVVLALAAAYWLGGRDGSRGEAMNPEQAPFAAAGSDGSAASPPPLTGSMRDQADRLFERIMQARARGDSTEANFFLPMAIQAYQGAGDLDADGLFHLGLLQVEAGSAADAARTADRIAVLDPDHLLGHALRADAALASGDEAAARIAFSRFLERFDTEVARDLPEYRMHRPALDGYRERALQLTGG